MSDFWTVTETPVGYELFRPGLEYAIDEEMQSSELKALDIGASDGKAFSEFADKLETSRGTSFETYSLEPQDVIYRGDHENPVRGMTGHEKHEIPFKHESFDIVISNYLLPFIGEASQKRALQDITNILSSNGFAAIHFRPYSEGCTERLITDQDTLESSIEEYPLKVERSDNLIHGDSRDDLPSGFYDEFYENF